MKQTIEEDKEPEKSGQFLYSLHCNLMIVNNPFKVIVSLYIHIYIIYNLNFPVSTIVCFFPQSHIDKFQAQGGIGPDCPKKITDCKTYVFQYSKLAS